MFFFKRPPASLELLKQAHQTLSESPQEDLIPYLFIGYKGDSLIVAIENHSGEPLERTLYREHHLNEVLALEFVFQIAKGLASAQKLGVLHGNLAPSQIWTDGLQCKVLGFYLPLGDEPTFYQAPELFKEPYLPLQIHQDLYALGAIWYQLLIGMPPYQGEAKELYRNKKKVLSPLKEIPEETFSVLQKMLAPATEQRFQSYNDFFVRLLQIRNKLLSPPLKEEGEFPFVLPSESRIDFFMSRLEQSRSVANQKTRRTLRLRRILLPSMTFLGAVSLLLITTVAFPALLNRNQKDLFELIKLTEEVGTSPEEQESFRREKLAKEAFQRAEEAFQAKENLSEGIILFTEVARGFRETRSGQEAETRLHSLKKQLQEKSEEEYLIAYKKSQEFQAEERFQSAIEVLELYLSTFPDSEKKEALFQTIEQIRTLAETQFQKEKQKAQVWITQKKYLEAKQIFHRIIDIYGIKTLSNAATSEIEQIERLEQTTLALSTKNKEEQDKRNLAKLQLAIKTFRTFLIQNDFEASKSFLQKAETLYPGEACRDYLQNWFLIMQLQENVIAFVLELNEEYAQTHKNKGYELADLIPESKRKGYLLPQSTSQYLLVALSNSSPSKIYWHQLEAEEKIQFLKNMMDKHQGAKKLNKGIPAKNGIPAIPPSPQWFEYRMLGIGVFYLIHEKYEKARELFQNALLSNDPVIKKKAEQFILILFQFSRDK